MQKYDFDSRGLAWVVSYGFSISSDSDVLFYQTPSNDDFPKLEQWYQQVTIDSTIDVPYSNSLTISGVTGTYGSLTNGVYTEASRLNDYPRFFQSGGDVTVTFSHTGSQWEISINDDGDVSIGGTNPSTSKVVPSTGWTLTSPLLSGCLLYTSPSPRDGLLSRMPSSA